MEIVGEGRGGGPGRGARNLKGTLSGFELEGNLRFCIPKHSEPSICTPAKLAQASRRSKQSLAYLQYDNGVLKA